MRKLLKYYFNGIRLLLATKCLEKNKLKIAHFLMAKKDKELLNKCYMENAYHLEEKRKLMEID